MDSKNIKVGILAGGFGTRLAEETEVRPKPMVEIGCRPILWHIMKHYGHFGFKNFVIALGYKGEIIKKYLLDFGSLHGNLTIDLKNNHVEAHQGPGLDWTMELIDTGIKTQTGGRIRRLAPYLGKGTFMITWGDGVADLDLNRLLEFHRSHGRLATVTAVRPPARYGYMKFSNNRVTEFTEKPQIGEGWINGAFFVLEPGVLEYIENDETIWEREPMERLARDGELMAFKHSGFWQCMDTLREKHILESLWQSGHAPWKLWKD